jgi:hypothetical protein
MYANGLKFCDYLLVEKKLQTLPGTNFWLASMKYCSPKNSFSRPFQKPYSGDVDPEKIPTENRLLP